MSIFEHFIVLDKMPTILKSDKKFFFFCTLQNKPCFSSLTHKTEKWSEIVPHLKAFVAT